jgi:murein DD-endopeptidase MepM/ murein hydrolase activator NlpD
VQIILVSRHLKTARNVTIMPQHLLFAVIALCGLIVLTSLTFSWLSMEFRLPLVRDLMSSLQRKENLKTQETMSNNLSFMATRVGELQAQVIQLDSLGERLSKLAGVGRESAPPVKAQPKSDGQGGPFIATHATYTDLQQQIERLTQLVESKTDELSMLESRFLEKRVRERLLPTMLPVTASRIGSGYGYRSDPLAGVRAMHEGIDFVAPAGTPILAAAAGVVVVAEYHNAFGNMVDIDHGDGLISRYAHMSQIALKSGQMVRRGQRVGLVGSTGRSTGPHLHFEVRMMGVAQNPAVLLRQGDNFAQAQTP